MTRREERFEALRHRVGLLLGPALFALVMLLPMAELRPEAHRLAAVLALTVTWWITEPVPLAATALLAPCLCVALGVAPAKPTLSAFSDPVIFLFLGSFMLAQAMIHHGLDRRIALSLLSVRWVGDSTRRILLVFGAVAALISMWLSNTATTAMMLPIGLGILGEVAALHGRQTGRAVDPRTLRLSTALMLMTAYGASVGGIGTPVGSPPNLIGIGMIAQQTGEQIRFAPWMGFALPAVVVMFLGLCGLLLWLHPPEIRRLTGLAAYLQERRATLGPWTRGQVNTCIAFGTAVVLWTLPAPVTLLLGADSAVADRLGDLLPEAVVAILAASLLFVLPVDWRRQRFTLPWSEAVKIDWGTILLFGGGIALGGLSASTGLAAHVGESLRSATGLAGEGGIALAAIALAIVISELTSNTASATIVVPIAIALAQGAGVNPLGPAVGACLGASYGFMLPVSTPPNALVYGTGMVPILRMVKTGLAFDMLGLGIIWATVMIAF